MSESKWPPIWVWQTTGAMLAVSLDVFYFTGDSGWAAISQIPVAWGVGYLSVNRYIRREGWRATARSGRR